MKYGYMSGFMADLESEIKFANEHFDFIEITLMPELLERPLQYFSKLKNIINSFEVIGHIHWELKEPEIICKNIRIIKMFGAKKIIIHPLPCGQQALKKSIQDNIIFLSEINQFCEKNEVQLLVENVSAKPFNMSANIATLTDRIPGLGIALDIGHANKTSKTELGRFLKSCGQKIKHIHLHDSANKADHLFFESREKLNGIISKINSAGYNGTITMETFSVIKNGRPVSLDFPEIKEMHIRQLKLIGII